MSGRKSSGGRGRAGGNRAAGDVSGNVSGNVAGNVSGDRSGGNISGNVIGERSGGKLSGERGSGGHVAGERGGGSSRLFGAESTRFFHGLTPDRILGAVEQSGLTCTGRCLALNSMENRVYDIEVEVEGEVRSPSDRFRVAKFYRPGRWSREQILEEHRFLRELAEAEIPVVPPLPLGGGTGDGEDERAALGGDTRDQDDDDTTICDDAGATLGELSDLGIYFALFPRVGGRLSDEISEAEAEQLGRLLARVHMVGARSTAPSRLQLDVDTYGRGNLEYLLESGTIPAPYRDRYRHVAEAICDRAQPWFAQADVQRIHGDCHLGNILWGRDGAMLVDFDDMLRGPCVQDLWLIAPGRDEWARARRRALIDGYEQLRDFDHSTLRLVEPLRALRLLHFAAWIARRWEDAAFARVFTDFRTDRYWVEQVEALQECLGSLDEPGA
ncbi:MAG TPA: serine/threonine protein kinase [Candidatus Limnocylindrales bacterium]|nr:serine/threonine protein kinase [Candidatus Limnocylindrales bacterium]